IRIGVSKKSGKSRLSSSRRQPRGVTRSVGYPSWVPGSTWLLACAIRAPHARGQHDRTVGGAGPVPAPPNNVNSVLAPSLQRDVGALVGRLDVGPSGSVQDAPLGA